MRTASISDIKNELISLPPKEVLELCLRVIKYKKENKELLTYLLFEAHDPSGFTTSIKNEIDESMKDVPTNNLYHAKKALRKILKTISKHSKHMASKQAEVELLLHFCKAMLQKKLPLRRSVALTNLLASQLKKIKALILLLHEDLRFDYSKQLEEIISQ